MAMMSWGWRGGPPRVYLPHSQPWLRSTSARASPPMRDCQEKEPDRSIVKKVTFLTGWERYQSLSHHPTLFLLDDKDIKEELKPTSSMDPSSNK